LGLPKISRVAIGGLIAIGLLSAVPAAVLAAPLACGDTLTTSRTLNADLDCSAYSGNALTMGANDVVLNLNGHKIWGPTGDEGDYGVDTDGYNRTTIKNGTINRYYGGVYVNESNRTLVQNVKFNGENNGDYGVYVYYGVKNTLNNIETIGTETGVYATYGARLTVTNSTLRGDIGGGYGLYLDDETADTVSGNTLRGYYGVYDYESHRQSYSANNASNTSYGFYLECDGYGTVNVTGNTANQTDSYGFYIYECYAVDHPVDGFTGSRIVGNTANDGSGYGFYDYYSFNELWKDNTANDNDSTGFYFDYPSNFRIVTNKALRNAGYGFELSDNYSYYNVDAISNNTAKDNDSYGFYASYGAPGDGNVATGNSPNCYNVDC